MANLELTPKTDIHPGHLLLDIPSSAIEIPSRIQEYAERNGYEEKSEYHITVLGRQAVEAISSNNLQSKVEQLVGQVAIWNMLPADCHVELGKHDEEVGTTKQSIVQMVYIEEMLNLYTQVRNQTALKIPTPPAHITLYTKGSASGIGLYSAKDLQASFIKCL